MEYKTKSGYILTESMLDKLGELCEQGNYPGTTGKFIVAPVGRPPMYPNDALVTVAFKMPRSYCEKLDEAAKMKNESRSEFIREVLVEALEG